MSDDEEAEADIAIDDDAAVETLAPFYDVRPARHAWRNDAGAAPMGKPVYARTPDSIRVLIAMRDEEGWVNIRRDGELQTLDAIGSWAPLTAAIS